MSASNAAQHVLDESLRYLACWSYEILTDANVRSLVSAVLLRNERVMAWEIEWICCMAKDSVAKRILPELTLDEAIGLEERYTFGLTLY